MTDRLYYADPYLRSFDARVERVGERGGRHLVFLDRSAFYPTSGGQPFDVGRLGAAAVVDVFDEEDGSVAHVVDQAVFRPGDAVAGEIDWTRRFDHMQQHTGQHVLSAAFDRLFRVRTVSFHLGADASTIDLAREMTPDEIVHAEDEANRIVWEDRVVSIRFVSSDEAASLPLRKEPARQGSLRLIDVSDWDLSACGGTHVARTGAIGVVAVAAWERFKGGQRVEFLCGGRALRRFRTLRDTVASSVRLLSVHPGELPAAIDRMQADARDQKRTLGALQSELAAYRAAELAARAEPGAGSRRVLHSLEGDASVLKSLASAVTANPGFVVVLTTPAPPLLVVVARSADQRLPAQEILAGLVREFGGRGGGRPELAQGGGLSGDASAVLRRARELITERES